jgi:superfamily II DNA or RNA helicase
MTATPPTVLDQIAAGSRVVVRDQDWQVIEVERQTFGSAIVRCIGRSELVRDRPASFFSDIDVIEPEDPAKTRFRLDTSPHGVETRLILESLIRRTPVPISNTNLTVGHRMLADDLSYQREPFRMAMEQLQPRLLIADAVGLGKTIEVGMLLSELQRRGRANRVLAVVPRHILDQLQHELWCRFAFPLVRLDSTGIQRVRQKIPSGQNPFTYFNRVIVSIDTLKNPSRYRHHLERVRWDVVWIDEAHSIANRSAQRSQLAQILAPTADALILTTATPHNGKPDAFANLIERLDPTAVPDPDEVTVDDIKHLVIRRHKHSPDVAAVVGDRWAERAEPRPISVAPSDEEEAVFAELSATWLSRDHPAPTHDRLFSYTLLKAALSSPAALEESIENRLTTRRLDVLKGPDTATSDPEGEALRRLWLLTQASKDAGSAKLAQLMTTLREIGIGKNSDARVVIFSERIRTLDWIADAIRTDLDMSEAQVQTFHNSKNDEEQQRIVEDFSMASADIRVLVTSDIASEGVNLHKQCHQMIHFDLPWSLITLEQRNGRIDRYGQLVPPEIRYLIYSPADPEVAGDVRVLSKLIEKEHIAHKALGSAAPVLGVYTEKLEQDAIIRALQAGDVEDKEAELDATADSGAAFDPWAYLGLDGGGDDAPPAAAVEVDPPSSLFSDPLEYLTAGLGWVYEDLSALGVEADEVSIMFEPPDDLILRLGALPQSYLRQRELDRRIRLTIDHSVADKSLSDAVNAKAIAGESGTAWPEIHFLAPQHPVVEWLADKVLARVGRNEAIAISADVDESVVLISGVWSNKRGEPISGWWLAASLEDGIVTFEDMFPVLERAGVIGGMVNAEWDGDLSTAEALVQPVVTAAISRLRDNVDDALAVTTRRLSGTRQRLEEWQVKARQRADEIKSDPHRIRRLQHIESVIAQIQELIENHTPADSPLIRVVGALVPRG